MKQKIERMIARLILISPLIALAALIMIPLAICLAPKETTHVHVDRAVAEPMTAPPAATPQAVEYPKITFEPDPYGVFMGEFKLTAYCACWRCCGKAEDDPAYKVTASGTICEEGRTIAVDPDLIPLGSTVYIDGKAYVAEDTGGAIQDKHIDIYFEDHQEALEFGAKTGVVYVCE